MVSNKLFTAWNVKTEKDWTKSKEMNCIVVVSIYVLNFSETEHAYKTKATKQSYTHPNERTQARMLREKGDEGERKNL